MMLLQTKQLTKLWPADCTCLPEFVQEFLSLPHSVLQATRLQRVLYLPRYSRQRQRQFKQQLACLTRMSATCRCCAARERTSACALHDGDLYVSSFVQLLDPRVNSWFCSAECSLLCRSPSVVIGYLMRLRRWRLNESYKWVHDRRAVVSLQEGNTHPAVLAELRKVVRSRV